MSLKNGTERLLAMIRGGEPMTVGQKVRLAVMLSVPSVVAQLSSIVMQYIDASMVGSLGAEASASIGLVSTTTWLFGGLLSSAAAGFSVQVAHLFGANNIDGARRVMRQGVVSVLAFSLLIASIGAAISSFLPGWLGGDLSIRHDASIYFLIISLCLPALQMEFLACGMLRCSGNMHVPSMAGVVMCLLDVLFNFFLIFPTRIASVFGMAVTIPGAGLGVEGAALGTVLAEIVVVVWLMWYLCCRSKVLRLDTLRGWRQSLVDTLRKAVKIGFPMGLEHGVICGAQIAVTTIVAPLGVCSLAANSFAITAESLCYMPGYGIGEAATTLVGQSVGARRRDLTLSFARITVGMGIGVMALMGVLMYVAAPEIIGLMTPVEEIRELGVMVLRIEAFAEPMFAASIVAYGVCVGAAYTMRPCLLNMLSIWVVRLITAASLAPTMGLRGVWIAMCIELIFRGASFLVLLWRRRWLKSVPE